MIDVPMTTEAATAEFATDALRSTGVIDADTSVAEVEYDRVGEGVGLMCELARLTFRYDGDAVGAPSSAILKLPSNLPENRTIGDLFNFYEREGRFYGEIGDAVGVRVPRTYFNHIDTDANRFALLLEDFGSRTMVSQVAGISAQRATEAVVALARVHATWWASPRLPELAWMPRSSDPIILAAGHEYRRVWDHFVELVGDDLPDGAIELGARIGPAFETKQIDGYESAPETLAHGDFRADNLMFDDTVSGPDHVGVLDWQIAMRSSGIGDVCYLLTQSMDVETRRASERDIVGAWYDSLCSSLRGAPDGYTLDDAWDGYREATGNLTVYAVVGGGGMDPENERGRELVVQMATRSFSAALDLGADAFIC